MLLDEAEMEREGERGRERKRERKREREREREDIGFFHSGGGRRTGRGEAASTGKERGRQAGWRSGSLLSALSLSLPREMVGGRVHVHLGWFVGLDAEFTFSQIPPHSL